MGEPNRHQKNFSFLACQTNQQHLKMQLHYDSKVRDGNNQTQGFGKDAKSRHRGSSKSHHQQMLSATKLPPPLKRIGSGCSAEGMHNLLRGGQPSPAQPLNLMSPAIRSDGGESRGIRILSLIDGGSGPGDFDAACHTATPGEKDDMPRESLPIDESSGRGPAERTREYQSLDQRLLSHNQQLRIPRDEADAQKEDNE